jgi:putative oxidoreductase
MKYIVLLGRILFTVQFIMSALTVHFTAQGAQYATSMGVPAAGLLVPLSGILILVGGLSILFGYKARLGAWLLVIFLVPVNIIMHPLGGGGQQAMMMMVLFMKDLSLTGAALMIAYFGAGPLSIDSAMKQNQSA